ncbi:hypothetical protein Q8F55_003626 [Vanrija albida]|uniref:C2H2-type domain-containing protein n=1 Tax=Vanrija albida TaxID=181172 RepID=A0ABR3Q4G4_9TREE
MDTRKRVRSASLSSSDGGVSDGGESDRDDHRDHVPAKLYRLPEGDKPHLCTMAPSCSQPGSSQAFATAAELDAHQAAMHRWVCRVPVREKPGRVPEGEAVLVVPEQFAGRSPLARGLGHKWRECGKVFPDERMLDLHYTETHDAIARERQERGEKIFECFLPPEQCAKAFLTPKKRRLHLIEKHYYPVTYFFSIVNHGMNQIARTDGPAASLIRPARKEPPADAPPKSPTHSRTHSNIGPPARPPPDIDVDMDGLAAKMANLESSLTFVPRAVGARRGRDRAARRAVTDLG